MKRTFRWSFFILQILALLIIYGNGFLVEKIPVDKIEAKILLEEIYNPLETFALSLSESAEPNLLVSRDIKTKDDFIELFNDRVSDKVIEQIYQDLVVLKDNKMYIDSAIYIPNIYSKNAKITSAYIEADGEHNFLKKIKLLKGFNHKSKERLIITQSWDVNGEFGERTTEFVKGEDGNWVLKGWSGNICYGYTQKYDNPWNLQRQRDSKQY